MIRANNRANDKIRNAKIVPDFIKFPEGACLFELGNTKIVCTASCEEKVPQFLKNTGSGWITAEYGMLPRSCPTRVIRESTAGKVGGRTHEIQRLIGRSLRSVVNLNMLGERTIWIDCDVLQADGGTRTAAISGSFVALIIALNKLKKSAIINSIPVSHYLAAISVGIINKISMLDLSYDEDSHADVDMNIVMDSEERLIEIQGTAEHEPFNLKQLDELILLAKAGVSEIVSLQKKILEGMGIVL
ncbi:MAG: ribonuclease PH [Candidatus Omnitrophota bacterium]